MPARNWSFPVLETVCFVALAALTAHVWYRASKSGRKSHPKTLLDPTEKYSLPLCEVTKLSHNTKRFRFKLPSEDHVLGLPIGQHITLSAKINNELVIRSYTPISSDDDDFGYVDLVVKIYRKDTHPRFPEGGKMSQYLESLKIGDTIDVRGPSGRLVYLGNGEFSIRNFRKDPPNIIHATKINMIAGGTGISPMWQLIKYVCKNSHDKLQMALLFANQTEKDILLQDELEQAAKDHPKKFKVWYTVDTADKAWKYSTGYVNDEMIREHLYPPSSKTFVLLCGPPPMINFACKPSLSKLGYNTNLIFTY